MLPFLLQRTNTAPSKGAAAGGSDAQRRAFGPAEPPSIPPAPEGAAASDAREAFEASERERLAKLKALFEGAVSSLLCAS